MNGGMTKSPLGENKIKSFLRCLSYEGGARERRRRVHMSEGGERKKGGGIALETGKMKMKK